MQYWTKPKKTLCLNHKRAQDNMTSKTYSAKQLIIGSMPQMPKDDVSNTNKKHQHCNSNMER
jgi:hypothetical protein